MAPLERPRPTGRGGTELVDTAAAAAQFGIDPSGFTTWARRRGVRAKVHVREGSTTKALWDVLTLMEADRVYRALGGEEDGEL